MLLGFNFFCARTNRFYCSDSLLLYEILKIHSLGKIILKKSYLSFRQKDKYYGSTFNAQKTLVFL